MGLLIKPADCSSIRCVQSADELSLVRGDYIELLEKDDDFGDGWYLGRHIESKRNGLFPEGRAHA